MREWALGELGNFAKTIAVDLVAAGADELIKRLRPAPKRSGCPRQEHGKQRAEGNQACTDDKSPPTGESKNNVSTAKDHPQNGHNRRQQAKGNQACAGSNGSDGPTTVPIKDNRTPAQRFNNSAQHCAAARAQAVRRGMPPARMAACGHA
ncbi:hypothetical protein DUNSADRAFT_11992 [Dunaliella salina]|uniref:Encoded protein n=1 Tax=Dunaliella salina TaxID=3046 RepID=A0ABQ7GC72_DUNSA|nr:hypothetical protein DUNSADRAFT_11992 [Dunaliella salina]|eukprot:KAF5832208.1 hypothetical protein DUNSADRAFT_11992 [Dunaliella salina]